MKQTIMIRSTIGRILVCFLLCAGIVSCGIPQDDDHPVSEIRFSGKIGMPQTKTVYKGVTSGGLEVIDWEIGDGLTLLSPDAMTYNKNGIPWKLEHNESAPLDHSRADYKIISNASSGYIAKADMVPNTSTGSGLQWEQTGGYRFYGMYPSSASSADPSQVSIALESADAARLTAYIPQTQVRDSISSSADEVRLWPDMRCAYMYAYAKATVSEAGKWPEVDMDFYPMVTAFQFTVGTTVGTTLYASGPLFLYRLELSSPTCALSGSYIAKVEELSATDPDLDKYTTPGRSANSLSKISYITLPPAPSAGKRDTLAFDFPAPQEVDPNKPVVVTLFVLPKGVKSNASGSVLKDYPGGSVITDLRVTFYTEYRPSTSTSKIKVARSLDLRPNDDPATYPKNNITLSANNFVEFPAGKKINISGLTLPDQLDPWRFSVAATDYIDEISDIVVSPVEMKVWEVVDGGRLDQSMEYTITLPAELTVAKGDFSELKATVMEKKAGGQEVNPATVEWIIDELVTTRASLTPSAGAKAWVGGLEIGAAGSVKARVTIAGKTYTSDKCKIEVIASNKASTTPYTSGGNLGF